MTTITSRLEHETTYTLRERYYLTANKEQHVERILMCTHEGYAKEIVATEDYQSMSERIEDQQRSQTVDYKSISNNNYNS